MATIRLFLKDEVKNSPNYKEEKKWYPNGGEYYERLFGDIKVSKDDGRVYKGMSSLIIHQIPSVLLDLIEEVTIYAQIPKKWKRLNGIYTNKSATATLRDLHDNTYELELKADNVKDAKTLYGSILAGKIYPAVSWEKMQITKMQSVRLACWNCLKEIMDTLFKPFTISETV